MGTLKFVVDEETGYDKTIAQIIESNTVGYYSQGVEKADEKATTAIQTCANILELLHDKGLISKEEIKKLIF